MFTISPELLQSANQVVSIYHIWAAALAGFSACAAAIVAIWKANVSLSNKFIASLENIVTENKSGMVELKNSVNVFKDELLEHRRILTDLHKEIKAYNRWNSR